MAKASKAARACVAHEIAKHCEAKRGKCKSKKERKQAVAVGFAICRREGYHSIPKRKRARR